MDIKEIQAKSLLIKHKKIDSWFLARYGMNLYRGCAHDCAYCDGRAEKYNVEGEFGRQVTVKVNAVELLVRALDPKRKRIPLKRSFICLGGGVGDTYQPIEAEYKLACQVLKVISETDFPVHVLTKSSLVERDLDLLTSIHRRSRAILSMSFSTVDDDISRTFEPGCSPPSRRLKVLETMKAAGLLTGFYMLPIIPFVTDTDRHLDECLRRASEVGVDFVLFGGMTLKEGRQKEHFLSVLGRRKPELLPEYETIYSGDRWGMPGKRYSDDLHRRFIALAGSRNLSIRVPSFVYRDILDENDRVVVMLENLDYLLKTRGRTSPYGYAAYSVSQLKAPLSEMRENLQSLKGVGPATERIIQEILDTGTSSFFESLMTGDDANS
jgi:DNA repair photolyase